MRWVVGGSSREVRDHHARGPGVIVWTSPRTDGKDLEVLFGLIMVLTYTCSFQCRRNRSCLLVEHLPGDFHPTRGCQTLLARQCLCKVQAFP